MILICLGPLSKSKKLLGIEILGEMRQWLENTFFLQQKWRFNLIQPGKVRDTAYNSEIMVTLWLFNIAMENDPFIDGLPIKNDDCPWLC